MNAQVPDTLWTRTFGGNLNEVANAVIHVDSTLLVVGSSNTFGAGISSFWTIALNSEGDSIWSRAFIGGWRDVCSSALSLPDEGNVILAGNVEGIGAGESDVWLVKASAAGDSLWSRTYGGVGADRCESITRTSSGNYLLGGSTRSFGVAGRDFYVLLVDQLGDTLWTRTFGGGNPTDFGVVRDDVCGYVGETSSGDFLLVGNSYPFGPGQWDYWILKISQTGDSLWSRAYGGTATDYCISGCITNDDGCILVGYTTSFGNQDDGDVFVLRVDSNGDSLWSRVFAWERGEVGNSVKQLEDGGFIIGGYTYSFGAGSDDPFLLRLDENGDSLWCGTYGNVLSDICEDVIINEDDGYTFVGSRATGIGTNRNFLVVRTQNDPVLASIKPNSTPSAFQSRMDIFPNPFNQSVRIDFAMPFSVVASISIFDLLGRKVDQLISGNMTAGHHSITWNCSTCSNGVYLIVMDTPKFRSVRKALFLK